MPKEIFDKEEFLELSEKATECTIKKNPENTKLKLRTSKYIYTLVLEHDEANELAKQINCPTIEI
jgi:large subunit ribosomal protein L38e